jgi:glycosyltransferase involved in cell wall biosynthesis
VIDGRIGVNLLWLVPGVVGGSEEYTVRLLASYARVQRRGPELVLFVNGSLRAAHPGLTAAYRTIEAPIGGSHKSLRVAAEATWLGRQARAEGIDLMHHMGGNMLRTNPPGMVTLHDLQPFAHPSHFSPLKRGYLERTVPTALQRAVLVVVLSQHTRHDVVERIGVPADRILLVPPGLDRLDQAHDPAEAARVRWTYDLDSRPFFIYPGITYAHKNHETLARAFARLAATHPEPLLALSGGVAEAEGSLRATIDDLGIADRVRRLGRIPRRDLDILMAEATALTFPSTYEGFGIPVLEAMSRRCPVIVSTATALPEIAGGAGLFVAPDDVEGWAAAMAGLLDDPAERARLAELGYQRAADFSWERSTDALWAAYQLGLERIRP